MDYPSDLRSQTEDRDLKSAYARPFFAPRLFVASVGLVTLFLLGLSVPGKAIARQGDGADGRFERRDSFHFVLFQDVDLDDYGGFHGSRRFERDVLDELESAFDRLDRILGLRPERKLEVYVWDPARFDAQFAGLFRFPAAGFYGGTIHVRGGVEVTPSLVRVLHHELVHAAFDAAAPRLTLPAWMNEGIAEWFEARALGKRELSAGERGALQRAAQRGALFSLSDLSSPSLGHLPPNAARLAYLQSYGFVSYLSARHGERRLVQFWQQLVRSRSLERASKRAFRRELDALEAGFRRSLGAR